MKINLFDKAVYPSNPLTNDLSRLWITDNQISNYMYKESKD